MKQLLDNLSAMLLLDFYKLAHRPMYPYSTEYVYSTWTPRTSRIKGITDVVVAGQQAFIKNYLIGFYNENFFNKPKETVVKEYVRVVKYCLGKQDPYTKHIEELHDLGHIPLLIKSLPEGTIAPVRVPVSTFENTDKRFYWFTNYIETLASCELWQVSTSATLALEFKKKLDKYAMLTVGNTDFTPFQGHDFSMRGMSSLFSAINSGMGHLMSFVGTDTVPAILACETFYNANIETELVGCSVDASEHSIQTAYENDKVYIERLITEINPTGIVSIVSDGRDFWDVVENTLPELKDKIMARDGKLVIRPDSGVPEFIICGDPNGKTEIERKGLIQALWETFGGTTTEKGYELLDSHIGAIYGDSITLERTEYICKTLMEKGFASINIVLGIGSFTYQYNTRDTFGYALKSTFCIIDGVEKKMFKDPKTDDGTKKSQKGKVAVLKDGNSYKFVDNLGYSEIVEGDLLRPIFLNGKLLVDDSLQTIRNRIKEHILE